MGPRALLLCLLLPAAAAAQSQDSAGDPGRADLKRPWFGAAAGYSDSSGLAYRSGRLSGSAPLGRGFALDGGFSDHRILRDGWLPGELYDAGLRLSGKAGRYAFSAGLRSASDRPFHSVHETDLSLNASRTIRSEGRHRLSFGLAYSSRRSFARGMPFPYLLYGYYSEKLVFNLPFSAEWRPSRALALSAAYVPPKYLRAGVSRRFSDRLRLKAEYASGALQYDLAGRQDKSYSVFIEQRTAGLWTFYGPAGDYYLSLWTGWTLGGSYYSGKTYDEHRDERSTGSSPAVSIGLYRLF